MAIVFRRRPQTIVLEVSKPISDESRLLDRSIGDLTSALGDPTRRAIFIAIREASEPVTTATVAKLFGIHANVARHHLDKLATDGYLHVTRSRPSGRGGPGAGRPAKRYTASGKPIDLHFPARRYELLIDLLVRIIDRIGPADVSVVAEEVGRSYGRDLADEIGAPTDAGYEAAVTAVARAMTGLGFEMSADLDGQRLLTSHCPFGDAAVVHPDVLCSLDRGIVTGLFDGLRTPCEPVVHPHHDPVEACVTEVPLVIGRR